MDPNETLRCALSMAYRIIRDGNDGIDPTSEDAEILAAHFIALHNWITSGGFIPNAWMNPNSKE